MLSFHMSRLEIYFPGVGNLLSEFSKTFACDSRLARHEVIEHPASQAAATRRRRGGSLLGA